MRLQNLKPAMLEAISQIRGKRSMGASPSSTMTPQSSVTVMRASAKSNAYARAEDKADDTQVRDVRELIKCGCD